VLYFCVAAPILALFVVAAELVSKYGEYKVAGKVANKFANILQTLQIPYYFPPLK
jgi:hypothetical protein